MSCCSAATRGQSLSRASRKPENESVKKNLVIESFESSRDSFSKAGLRKLRPGATGTRERVKDIAMPDSPPADLVHALRRRHGESQRHYHDWTHIEALLAHADSIRTSLHDPDAVTLAILFHDAVYDPKAKDNERRSADLLRATEVDADPATKALAVRMIEATEGHYLPDDLEGEQREDCAHFLDMDLAILGAGEDRFDIYEKQIRAEYAHVPDDTFRKGRAAVLRGFLERERLYFSAWGTERFEARARVNCARSIALLEEGAC